MLSVLQFDQSGFYRKTMQTLLSADFHYFGVDNEDSALQVLSKEKIDIIITAIEIGQEGAEVFIRKLNDHPTYRHTPVFVITSTDSLEERRRMFELGVVDYITKDTSPEEIAHYLKNFNKPDQLLKNLENIRIAVVDDSDLELKIVRHIMTQYHIDKVDYYTSVKELQNSPTVYDMFLVDIILKETTGERLIMSLREKNPSAMIIAVSGLDNYKTISNILSSGADDYITKPYNRELFMARLKANLRTYLLIRELEEKNRLLQK